MEDNTDKSKKKDAKEVPQGKGYDHVKQKPKSEEEE